MTNDKGNTKPKTTDAARISAKPEQRRIRNSNRGNADLAEWNNANAELLVKAIGSVTSRNCAIQFGYTRDAGAYVVRIVGDGEPYNEYIRPTEDLNGFLQSLIDDFGG
jgi:hypothetical protein